MDWWIKRSSSYPEVRGEEDGEEMIQMGVDEKLREKEEVEERKTVRQIVKTE